MPRLQQHPSNPVLQGRTPPGGCLPCLVVGCVSRDRAACGRWPGRASPAPKNQPSSRLQINRCQTSGRWRTNADMTALTFLETEGRLRTRKPNRHAVVALPSLVAVQNTTPRSDQPGRAPENHPNRGWNDRRTHPHNPHWDPFGTLLNAGNSNPVYFLAGHFSIRSICGQSEPFWFISESR